MVFEQIEVKSREEEDEDDNLVWWMVLDCELTGSRGGEEGESKLRLVRLVWSLVN